MTENTPQDIEHELAEFAEQLTAPGMHECLRCYLLRLITEFGCDGTYRWTIRWRDVRAARPRALLRLLAEQGGFCDCEVLLNVFPDYPDVPQLLPCSGVGRSGSPRPCDLGALRNSA
jgi:hypothetical protein